MSFKLLIKQAFKNLTSKFRLYISLVLFLIVVFSVISGLTTFSFKFDKSFTDIVRKYPQPNFHFSSFKYLANSSKEKDDENYFFRLTKDGEANFKDYLVSGLTEFINKNSNKTNDGNFIDTKDNVGKFFDEQKIIARAGENSGNIAQLYPISQNVKQDEMDINNYYLELNDWTLYYSHNILMQYLSDSNGYLKSQDPGIQLGVQGSALVGADKDEPGIQVDVKVNEETINDRPNPFKRSGFNSLYHFKTTSYSKDKDKNENLPDFYVSSNYLLQAKKKVGDIISLSVNSQTVNGKIAGTATDNLSIILANGVVNAYVDQKSFGQLAGPQYLGDLLLDGYIPIENSTGAYDNIQDLQIAANLLNKIILKDANDNFLNETKDKMAKINNFYLFESTNKNNSLPIKTMPIQPIDPLLYSIGKYHTPQNIYRYFVIFLDVGLAILAIVVAIFIIQESINSEKKTLWFLKSMGENNFVLSLVNAFSILVPLLVSIGIAIPGTMLIMGLIQQALLLQYAFTIHWYELTIVTLIVLILFFVITMLLFILINLVLVSGNALSQENNLKPTRFQEFLIKITNPFVVHASSKFRIGFAFVRQNFAKNLVTFVLFTILFTVTLFGVQFNHSISNQKNNFKNWFGDYNAISTMYPQSPLTEETAIESKTTTYQLIFDEKYQENRKEDQKVSVDMIGDKSLEKKYNYDLFYFLTEYVFGGTEKNDQQTNPFANPGFLIDKDSREIIMLPSRPEEQFQVMLRLLISFGIKLNYEDIENVMNNLPSSKFPWIKPIDFALIEKNHPNYDKNQKVNLAQWYVRQLRDFSNWQVYDSYFSSFLERVDESGSDNLNKLYEKIMEFLDENPSLNNVKVMFGSLVNIYRAQHDTFNIKYPKLNIYFSNIVKPADALSSLQIRTTYKGSAIPFYGINVDAQPFVGKPIEGLNYDPGLGWKEDDFGRRTLNTKVSELLKNRLDLSIGDVIPLDLTSFGINGNYGFRVSGFVHEDSVLTEGFFDVQGFYALLRQNLPKIYNAKNLENTIYTKSTIPYFLQNISISHYIGSGSFIDDYLYKLETINTDQKTVDLIGQTFARTVDEYIQLVTRLIILLIVLCIALSSIIITLVLFENKKTILLFKAMGYRKQDIIWYLVTGYLIASVLAFLISIGLSALLIKVFAPLVEKNIFLQLEFTNYWLFYLIGIFETLFFMSMVVVSIVTYTRILRPRDAFSTL